MPKSKTQAQKNEEKQNKRDEQAAKKREEKVARDQELKNSVKISAPDQPVALSKKALRKQKQQAAEEQEKETQEEEEAQENETNDLDDSSESPEVEEVDSYIIEPAASPAPVEMKTSNNNIVVKSDVTSSTIISSTHELKTTSDSGADHEARKLLAQTREKAHQVVCEEEKNHDPTSHPARVVQNHSTYCEGLKTVLTRLQTFLPGCKITPGEISTCSSNSEVFELRFQRALDDNNYKFVARNGHTVQDVFINIPDPKTTTIKYVRNCIDEIISKMADRSVVKTDELDEVPSSALNRMVHDARNSMWKTEHHKKHVEAKQREKDSREEKQIREQSRKLASKVPAAARAGYAKRDVRILIGEDRTEYSMK
jgi:hypothetical protein